MSVWFWHGLRNGIQSTRYPRAPEAAAGVSPGRPLDTDFPSGEEASLAASNCPVNAISTSGSRALVDLRMCVFCQRCHIGVPNPLNWDTSYEWAQTPATTSAYEPLSGAFSRSLHVMVIDAGDCGACLHEVKQLNNPLYNMHRLGIFLHRNSADRGCLARGRPGEREHARAVAQDLRSHARPEAGSGRGNMRHHGRRFRTKLHVRRRRGLGSSCRSRNSGRPAAAARDSSRSLGGDREEGSVVPTGVTREGVLIWLPGPVRRFCCSSSSVRRTDLISSRES